MADPSAQPPDVALAVQRVRVRFGATTALDDVSFTAPYGDVTAILGPNAAGNSMQPKRSSRRPIPRPDERRQAMVSMHGPDPSRGVSPSRLPARWLVAALLASGCGDRSAAPALDPPDAAVVAPPDAAVPDAMADAAPPTPTVQLADVVVDAPGATGTGFGDPTRAINGVRGGGMTSGGLDVFSLGYVADRNDHITLRWSGGRLRNGPGPDLVVFENPFVSGSGTFMDLIIVEVSIDGATFRALPHRYTAADPSVYHNDPSLWQGFAGRTPVLLNADTNPVDPFDPVAAGGDGFDLDTIPGDDDLARAIRSDGVRFVRLVSASARVNPDTGAPYVHDGIANGPDIDGMVGRYVQAGSN